MLQKFSTKIRIETQNTHGVRTKNFLAVELKN